jgi:peptidoglycan-N-acetylglucosamine deacetylase
MHIFKRIIPKFFIFLLSISLMLLITQSAFSATNSTPVSRISTTSKSMALTFDAGSDAGNTSSILDILSSYNVKCTFFLTGEFAASNPQLTRRIINEGHEIGNHSYSHPDFTQISLSQMKDQITRTHNKITSVSGKAPSPLFRPPYGSYNSTVLQAAGETGYKSTLMWSIDTIDWKGISAAEIKQKVLDKAASGSIVLMHVGGGARYTPDALPGIIEGLKSKGYGLKTVSQMLSEISTSTKTYVVQRGDTLWKIAQMFGVSINQLVNTNNIVNPSLIYVGQVLVIPIKPSPAPAPTPLPSNTYVVQSGNTLWGISSRFGVKVLDLAALNNITNINLIYPGQILKIPGNTILPAPKNTYVVKSGDTLWRISINFGVAADAIARANNIHSPYIIYTGQVLVIPSK